MSGESQKVNTEIPGGNWSTQGKLASVSCIYAIGTYAIDSRQGSHPRPWKRYGEGLARQTKSKHDNHEIQILICKIRESLRIRKSLLIIARIAFELNFESLEDQANWSCDHTLENWPSGGAGLFKSEVVLTTTMHDTISNTSATKAKPYEMEGASEASSSDSSRKIDDEEALEDV